MSEDTAAEGNRHVPDEGQEATWQSVFLQAYLGDRADVQLHEGTRVTGYAPNSEDAISKLFQPF